METLKKPHAAMLASPGLGHLIPVIELAKRLVVHHNFAVTIFAIPSHSSPAEAQLLEAAMSPKLFDVVELPQPDISGQVSPDAAVVTCLAVMMRTCRPAFRLAISSMENRPNLLIVDLFGTEYLSIAEELQIPKYVYIATNAWFLALNIYLPVLDKEVNGEYVDQKERLRIPGCRSLWPQDVVDPMLDRSDQQYREYLRIGTEIPISDGVLMNTWEDLQQTTLDALRNDNFLGRYCKVPVYTIGPLTRPIANQRDEIFDWLDKQPGETGFGLKSCDIST
ncbi:hypothetical protein TIFTF001_035352 [Ficus carica]|uniref:Uncharacterized protein n=1 Tax=Ficus carica TaxID=3494 RepID=A0AA88E290_FICCA|nr:hypothetical protein TIFTF001_035311 [Ficus carica]GMN66263.1 hypothetical protein TIFTF001_035328 [Ficus carica]GMN66264.1 hypothetical protein TIFTF001_035335 [Ficus carica]GMN66287.1 hypothetical protein TIFTF001_035352 [Ficus carica]